MIDFVKELKRRNTLLYWYGIIHFVMALGSLLIIAISDTYIMGVPAFLKPMKFFISIAIFVWTMGWILHYLKLPRAEKAYTWMVIIAFAIENAIIIWQAANGRTSHFNISTPLYSNLFKLMGVVITILTLWTGYIGYLFFKVKNLQLPAPYLWGIRLGITCFVIFAFEGGAMAAILRHTVGAADGGTGMPLTNWSYKHGDLRIAHFFGMHTLQVFPLYGYYAARKTIGMILFALAYIAFVIAILVQALMGLPAW